MSSYFSDGFEPLNVFAFIKVPLCLFLESHYLHFAHFTYHSLRRLLRFIGPEKLMYKSSTGLDMFKGNLIGVIVV